MTVLTWETATDWDNAQSETAVVHDAIGDRQADEVWLGWPSDVLTGPILYWTADLDSGSTLTDVSGNGNHGTLNGSASVGNTGILGSTSPDLDGVDDYGVTDNTFNAVSNDAISLVTWVNADSFFNNGNDDWFMQYHADSSNRTGMFFTDNGDNIKFFSNVGGNSDLYTNAAAHNQNTGDWAMFTLVLTNNAIRGYVNDGTLLIEDTSGSITVSNMGAGHLYWGTHSTDFTNFKLDGRVDEAMVFPAELTQSDVQALYQPVQSGSLTTGKKTS